MKISLLWIVQTIILNSSLVYIKYIHKLISILDWIIIVTII